MAESPQPPQNDTIFGRILRGEIPCDQVYADEQCIAFRDVSPQAPVHVLVIPREHVVNLLESEATHEQLLGHLLVVTPLLIKKGRERSLIQIRSPVRRAIK